ncbi:MAG: glycosyltransferase, partial [Methanomassiliicoccales archaeon]
NTSLSEGIPVSIMEAHSFGIPAIAPNVGGISEIVNNENGVLMNSNPSATEIAEAIIKIIEDNNKNSIMRANAYKNWKKNFDSAINYKQFSCILSNILEKKL